MQKYLVIHMFTPAIACSYQVYVQDHTVNNSPSPTDPGLHYIPHLTCTTDGYLCKRTALCVRACVCVCVWGGGGGDLQYYEIQVYTRKTHQASRWLAYLSSHSFIMHGIVIRLLSRCFLTTLHVTRIMAPRNIKLYT